MQTSLASQPAMVVSQFLKFVLSYLEYLVESTNLQIHTYKVLQMILMSLILMTNLSFALEKKPNFLRRSMYYTSHITVWSADVNATPRIPEVHWFMQSDTVQ